MVLNFTILGKIIENSPFCYFPNHIDNLHSILVTVQELDMRVGNARNVRSNVDYKNTKLVRV
jgi:hypothetical protein